MESKDLTPAQAKAMGIAHNFINGYFLEPPVALDAERVVGKAWHEKFGPVILVINTKTGTAKAFRGIEPEDLK